jgi:methanogenic corrinoid protein MtbC1
VIPPGEISTFLDRVESGRSPDAVAGILDLLEQGAGCGDIVTDVLAPIQREVGTRWQTARWNVADEHVSSAAVDDVLGSMSARMAPTTSRRSVALFSAEGEWHVTPLRMGALVFREHGWQVRLLGASTPHGDLGAALAHLRPQIAVVHCVVSTNLTGVRGAVEVAHAAGIPVIGAGAGFGIDDHRALRLGCDGWAPDVRAGARLAEAWLDAPPPIDDPLPVPHGEELTRLRMLQPGLHTRARELLRQRPAFMTGYDELQRELTLRHLDPVVAGAETALLVDDPRLFQELLDWLADVLTARNVPLSALSTGLGAVIDAADLRLPGLHELLEDGRRGVDRREGA